MTIPNILTSHTADVQVQFLAHLEADVNLMALLTAPGIYAGRAPRGSPRAYIAAEGGTERPRPSYGAGGTEGTDIYRIVAAGPGDLQVKRIYALFVASCSTFAMNPATNKSRVMSFRPTLTQTFEDPSDANGLTVIGVVRVDWRAYASQ